MAPRPWYLGHIDKYIEHRHKLKLCTLFTLFYIIIAAKTDIEVVMDYDEVLRAMLDRYQKLMKVKLSTFFVTIWSWKQSQMMNSNAFAKILNAS